jgi:septum formation protein
VIALLPLPAPLVLASSSPRRHALLKALGVPFTVVKPDVDEDSLSTQLPPMDYVQKLALAKATIGATMCNEPSIVLGVDTIVVAGGVIINKPAGAEQAVAMLHMLSNTTHTVYTGIALIYGAKVHSAYSATEVTFGELTAEEIDQYVATGSPFDKAGGYGIQDDFGSVFVDSIRGDYSTVVGLPLRLLYISLREFCE